MKNEERKNKCVCVCVCVHVRVCVCEHLKDVAAAAALKGRNCSFRPVSRGATALDIKKKKKKKKKGKL